MDGKGRVLDNLFVERLWRRVKNTRRSISSNISACRKPEPGLAAYFRFYNDEQPYQALRNRTPAEVHGLESPWPEAA